MKMDDLVGLVRLLESMDVENYMWQILMHIERDNKLSCSVERTWNHKDKFLVFSVDDVVL
ncbi:hypothetical protein D3C85_1742120 [compost metagenome]